MLQHILLIEDDFYLSRLYMRVLKKAGYTVTMVEHGEDALSALIGQKPDLILLDLLIPKIGGMKVLQSIKSNVNTSDIPVVILSNIEDDNVIEQAFDAGASAYWVKIVMLPQDLVLRVTEFFERKLSDIPYTIMFPKSFYNQDNNIKKAPKE